MFGAFKSQRISMQLMLPILGLLPFVGFFLFHDRVSLPTQNMQGWLYEMYVEKQHSGVVWLVLASFLQVILISYALFWMNIRYEILGQRTVLLSYVFLMMIGTPMMHQYLHPAGLSMVFLFSALLFLFKLYQGNKPLPDIYNAGLCAVIAIICYPPSLFFSPILFLAIVWLKEPRFRDFMALLLGLVTPVWVVIAVLILFGDLNYAWIGFKQWFEIRSTWPPMIPGNSKLMLIWMIWMLLSLPLAVSAARSRKDAGRRVMSILAHFSWISPVLFLVFEHVSFEIWQFMALHLSILFSLAILNTRINWISNLLFFSFFVFLLIFQLEYWI